MTPQEKRIAIAEACPKAAAINSAGVPVWRDRYEYPESSIKMCHVVFDPLDDLNAMHEAEETLTPAQHADYRL